MLIFAKGFAFHVTANFYITSFLTPYFQIDGFINSS